MNQINNNNFNFNNFNLNNLNEKTMKCYQYCRNLHKNKEDNRKKVKYYKLLLSYQKSIWNYLDFKKHTQCQVPRREPRRKPPKHQIPVLD